MTSNFFNDDFKDEEWWHIINYENDFPYDVKLLFINYEQRISRIMINFNNFSLIRSMLYMPIDYW